MTTQIQSSPSNKKISELYRRIRDKTLILQPDFQRKYVWTSSHKEAFIDTILNGLPFPEIYITQTGIDIAKIETQEVIVDGQQRLSTIVEYIDENPESLVFGKSVKKYRSLTDDQKSDFLGYNVVVRDLGNISPDMIKEVFKRINRTEFGLKQVEIQNAIYSGEFISTAKEILDSVSQDHIPIFFESELTRMSDLHFILLAMSTLENGGYFSKDSEVERYVMQFDNEYPDRRVMKDLVVNTLEQILALKLTKDSIWYRKSNFFTLMIELCQATRISAVPEKKSLKSRLENLELKILENKQEKTPENEFATYYAYMYTGTNNRQARVVRGNLFKKHVIQNGKQATRKKTA
ncbi:MAG TPA: DUF262 domain-containing protein [Planctomycetaceae bacterium]|nr:DUF262 domain-containing protein [Planctomycetaceae bacterium]